MTADKKDQQVITKFEEEDKRKFDLIVKDYEMALETQRHFNDLILKFRSIGFTITGVLLSAGLGAYKIHPLVSIGILLVTLVLLMTFKDFDQQYYHKLLLGGVEKNKKVDRIFENTKIKVLDQECGIFGLAEYITKSVRGQLEAGSKKREATNQKHTSEILIDKFYRKIKIIILVLGIFIFSYWIYSDFIASNLGVSKEKCKSNTVEVHNYKQNK